jgi:hypothetical protein
MVTGILGLVGIAVSGIGWTVFSQEMVDRVNAALPKGAQYSLLGWYWPKTLRLHREYRRLFPSGALLLKVRIAYGIALACMLICAWALGFFF